MTSFNDEFRKAQDRAHQPSCLPIVPTVSGCPKDVLLGEVGQLKYLVDYIFKRILNQHNDNGTNVLGSISRTCLTLRLVVVPGCTLTQEEWTDQARELAVRKNEDYGDAFATHGVAGILVRMSDKLARVKSLLDKPTIAVNSETLRDTWVDLYNYAILGVLLHMRGES